MAGCVDNTDSIALTVSGGELTADAIIDPGSGEPPNPLEINAAGLYVQGANGWLPLPVTLAYSSAAAPVFVATTSVDLTSYIGPGDKIWLVQSTSSLYFIVVGITSTTITLYGGTLYTLANSPITAPFFSKMNSPFGFPLSPASWTISINNSSALVQTSPVSGTWYNPGTGALSVLIPAGIWQVSYQTFIEVIASSGAVAADATLSTANNSETDLDFTSYEIQTDSADFGTTVNRGPKTLVLAVPTTYYLNYKATGSSLTSVGNDGSRSHTIIQVVCAYL